MNPRNSSNSHVSCYFSNLTLLQVPMAQFSYIQGDYFLLLIFFIPFLYLIFKPFKAYVSSKNIPPFPPGPRPWPLLGNIPQMANKMPHIALSDLSKIHGPLIMLRLGTQKMVVASSPAAAKEILKTHDRLLSARYIPKSVSINQEVLNNSSIVLTETCNEGWNYLRTLCRAELFSSKALDAQSIMREKKVLEMIEYVVKKGENDKVNIQEIVFVTLFNILSNMMLSNDLVGFDEKNEEDDGLKSLYRKMFEIFSVRNIADLFPILSKFDLQGIWESGKKIRKKIDAVHEPIIEGRRKEKACASSSQNDFLDVLLLNKFTNDRINQLMIELFSGGIDTSGSTIEWAMAELLKSPESMQKLIDELDKGVGTCLVKESHLVKLSYLHACIKETFRLHPPAPLLLPHRAPKTCQVMNYTIPQNAQVYINIWAMGRDPSIWDEPLVFKPERFLNAAADFKRNDFEFTPFGGGRRICPGYALAGRQVALILATLVHSFEWSLPKGKSCDHEKLDMSEKFGTTLHREQPLQLIAKARK